MDHQPYIPGTMPVDPGPLARFTPPLEEGTVSRWLSLHAPLGSWVLDPFGFSPRLVLEAARKSGVPVPLTATVAQQLNALMAQGWGKDDTASLLRVLELT